MEKTMKMKKRLKMKNGIEIEHNEKQGNYFEYVFHVYNCYRFLSLVLEEIIAMVTILYYVIVQKCSKGAINIQRIFYLITKMVIFLMSEKSYHGILIQIQITNKSRLFFKTFLFILFFLKRGGGKYSEFYGLKDNNILWSMNFYS